MSERDTLDAAAWLRRELVEIMREEVGLLESFAEKHAEAVLCGIRRRLGGREVYIPAPDKTDRDAQIRAMFNGRNLREVMREFGVSQRTVYRACNK